MHKIENKGTSFIKSKLILTFSIKNNYPQLKGQLTLANHKKIECKVSGNTSFEKPLKKSVSVETIKKQLSKVDNYPYQITQINVNYDGTLFIPISKINELRRDLFKEIEEEINKSYENKTEKIKLEFEEYEKKENSYSISFYTNNLNHLKILRGVNRVYLEIPPEKDSPILSCEESHNINYMISFLKEAIEISRDKEYELIWKWPDIAHDRLDKSLNKVKGILNKMHYNLPVMSNNYKGDYGPYSMNITNTQTIKSLENYKIVTISPELSKKDYENIISNCETPEKLEILVQGSVELMKSRYKLLYGGEIKKVENNSKFYLTDKKNNRYPVHKNISGEELILFNGEELSLLNEINHLKNIGFSNFAIDGRWKNNEYLNVIDIYKTCLKGEIKENELLKYSSKNTSGNYHE